VTTDRSEHWLWRLDARGWLRAADTERAAGLANLGARRTAITHARRAAGMAINAVLVVLKVPPDEELRWGRSYLDHLRILAESTVATRGPLPTRVQAIAAALLAIPVVPGELVQLGHGPDSAAQQALELARELCKICSGVVAARDATLPR
jgi:hypothetical protein